MIGKHMGRIIDGLSVLFCLGMAWLVWDQSGWRIVWLIGAALSFASAWLDTTGRMLAWLPRVLADGRARALRKDSRTAVPKALDPRKTRSARGLRHASGSHPARGRR